MKTKLKSSCLPADLDAVPIRLLLESLGQLREDVRRIEDALMATNCTVERMAGNLDELRDLHDGGPFHH